MRHAHAGYGPPDPERTLTEQGWSIAHGMAAFMRKHDFFDFVEIWSSPYARAEQTAEPVRQLWKGKPAYATHDFLTPMSDPEWLLSRLRQQEASLLVVGHNPHLSLAARALLGINSAHLPFKKGGVMAFNRDPRQETGFALAAYLTPSALGL